MNIVFRADSGNEIGSGHVMRCLTLATALQARGHSILFLGKDHQGNILHYVSRHGLKFCLLSIREKENKETELHHQKWVGGSQADDAAQSLEHIKREFSGAVDWVVVDHYGLDHHWENKVSEVAGNIMVIDDLVDRQHACDLLLDQTFGRVESEYFQYVNPSCEFLVGSRFSLIRDEFSVNQKDVLRIREKAAENPNKRILVMMGGMDQHNLTLRVLKALTNLPWIKITAVLGSRAPHLKSVLEFVEKHVQVELLIDCRSMAELMLEHDMCIGAAGTSSWERAAMGLPTAMLAFAENQKEILRKLVCYGAVCSIEIDSLEEDLFEAVKFLSHRDNYMSMVKACLSVCNGSGAGNIVFAMENNSIDEVRLRHAGEADSKLLFDWQQLSETRKYFRNNLAPSWEEHEEWFKSKICQNNCSLYLIMSNNEPIGSIRLEPIEKYHAEEISIQICPEKMGCGYAYRAMKKLLQRLNYKKKLYAYVVAENKPSHALFRKLGFENLTECEYIYNPNEVKPK